LLASTHIPLVLDGNWFREVAGKRYVDGYIFGQIPGCSASRVMSFPDEVMRVPITKMIGLEDAQAQLKSGLATPPSAAFLAIHEYPTKPYTFLRALFRLVFVIYYMWMVISSVFRRSPPAGQSPYGNPVETEHSFSASAASSSSSASASASLVAVSSNPSPPLQSSTTFGPSSDVSVAPPPVPVSNPTVRDRSGPLVNENSKTLSVVTTEQFSLEVASFSPQGSSPSAQLPSALLFPLSLTPSLSPPKRKLNQDQGASKRRWRSLP